MVFTNVANTVAAEMASGSGDLTITFAATLLTGTADVQALNLSGATSAATFTVTRYAGDTGTTKVDAAAITSTYSVAANGLDSITDFNFGTATTATDLIRIDLTSTTKVFGNASAVITVAAGTEILVLNTTAYADSSAAQSAARTLFGSNDNAAEAVVIWQDTLGNLNLSLYADASADATANGTLTNAMVKFVGLNLSSVGSLIGSGDFDIV